MRKEVVIHASEEEILNLVNKHFGTEEDSIVATQELDSGDWVTNVVPMDNELDYFISDKNTIKMFYFNDALDKLCFDGVIEAGQYIIDCSW